MAGWFAHCSGIKFGLSSVIQSINEYTIEDVYIDLSEKLQVPIIYDMDCGHVPPRITFISGAYAQVELEVGKAPRNFITRELLEETNQIARNVEFKGLMKFK